MKHLLLIIGMVISLFSCREVKYINSDDTLVNVNIQPIEAMKIAEPYIEQYATYLWKDEKLLKTHIVKKGKYYYISRTDYPAKTIWFYLQPAVRINSKNGDLKFIEK